MGTLYVVATPIGNLGDITYNAIEVLNKVSYIAAEDTRVSIHLLSHYNIKNKLIAYHKFNENAKSSKIIDLLKEGNDVAVVTDAGTPCISDPGSILVLEAIKNGINVISIPGANAVTTSLALSGMDTSSFSFYGFLSRENKNMNNELESIKNDNTKVSVIYESPKRIVKTLEKLKEYFPDANYCICNDLTKKFEKKYYGKIDEVMNELTSNDNHEKGEYVILIEKVNTIKEVDNDEISIEALLIDCMVKNNCSMKEAISFVQKNNKISKNDAYNASLNIKKMF